MARLVRLVPWVVALIPLLVLWQTIVGLIAGVVWIAVIASFRLAGRGRDRAARLGHDAILLICCVAAFILGGLYFAPAAVAFWLLDLRGPSATEAIPFREVSPPDLGLPWADGVRGGDRRHRGVSVPADIHVRFVVDDFGSSTVSTRTVLQIGLEPQAIAVLTLICVLFAVVAVSSVVPIRRQRLKPMLLGSAVLGLLVATILGGFSVGIFIAPGVLLAFVTFTVALVESDDAKLSSAPLGIPDNGRRLSTRITSRVSAQPENAPLTTIAGLPGVFNRARRLESTQSQSKSSFGFLSPRPFPSLPPLPYGRAPK